MYYHELYEREWAWVENSFIHHLWRHPWLLLDVTIKGIVPFRLLAFPLHLLWYAAAGCHGKLRTRLPVTHSHGPIYRAHDSTSTYMLLSLAILCVVCNKGASCLWCRRNAQEPVARHGSSWKDVVSAPALSANVHFLCQSTRLCHSTCWTPRQCGRHWGWTTTTEVCFCLWIILVGQWASLPHVELLSSHFVDLSFPKCWSASWESSGEVIFGQYQCFVFCIV